LAKLNEDFSSYTSSLTETGRDGKSYTCNYKILYLVPTKNDKITVENTFFGLDNIIIL